MGRGKLKRDAFVRDHPYCCFCGGSRPTEEVDHFPSRVLFRGRQWPEGYEFPACAACNRETSRDELIVSLLARLRMRDGSHSEIDAKEAECLLPGIRREFPGLLESMSQNISVRARRTTRERLGIQLPAGSSALDVPVYSVRDQRFHDAVLNFGRKFGLALFYKRFQVPMPMTGGVGVRWYSNVQVESGEIPSTFGDVVPDLPKLERAKIDLSDQFVYRVGSAQEDGTRIGAFRADFHASFAIVGFFTDRLPAIAAANSESVFATIFSPYDRS